MRSITKEQFRELEALEEMDYGEFLKRLEDYTGIKAEPCTEYQLYDAVGNYICDSCDSWVGDILEAAYVEVE